MVRFLIEFLKNPLIIFKIIYYSIVIIFCKLHGIKTIVYNLHYDYYFDLFQSTYKEISNNKKIKVFFSYWKPNKRLKKYLLQEVRRKYLISHNISIFINFDLFITGDINGPDFPISLLKTKTVETYHGSGVYPLYPKKEVLNRFDIHFSIGPQFNEFINWTYKGKKNKPKVYNTGYPKLDILLKQQDPLTEELKRIYKIENQPVLLYAPHWNSYGSLFLFYEELIEILVSFGYKVLIKPHNYIYFHYKEMNWEERLQKLEDKFENVILVKRPNTQELYPLSDIMITDTGTTTALEYSILKKPVFVFRNDRWFANEIHTEVEKDIIDLAFCFSSLEELKKYLDFVINKKSEIKNELDTQKEKQEKLVAKYLYNLGSATEKSVKAVLKELDLS